MLKNTLEPQQTKARGGAVPSFTSGTVVVPAKGLKSLGLGVYNSQDAEPVFDYSCSPDLRGHITASLEQLTMPGQTKYMLMYQFRNDSDSECRVDVVRHTD